MKTHRWIAAHCGLLVALVFGQSGLMAGVGVQGNKITPIDK